MMKFWIYLWGTFSLLYTAPLAGMDLDRAAFLKLNANGLAVLADVLEQQGMTDIDGESLPDRTESLDNGIKVDMEDMKFWVDFGDAELTTTQTHLRANIQIRKIRLDVRKMRFYRRVLGNTVSTTCRETTVAIGGAGSEVLGTNVTPTVRNRTLELIVQDVDFSIADDNFDVDGPDRCSGALGVGSLIRLALHRTLANAKDKVAAAIEARVSEAIPPLSDRVNLLLKREIPLEFSELGPLTAIQGSIATYPSTVTVDTTSLSFELGVSITSAKDLLFPSQAEAAPQSQLGKFGINPSLFEEAFRQLVGRSTNFIEITADDVPELDQLLGLPSAASIWPELNEAGTDEALRVWLKLDSPPSFRADGSADAISLMVDPITLRFKIEQGGAWRDFFQMRVRLAAELTISVAGDLIAISLRDRTQVLVEGEWATGYIPTIDIFEADVATALLESIFDYLYASGPLISAQSPAATAASYRLGLDNPSIQEPFLAFDVVAR